MEVRNTKNELTTYLKFDYCRDTSQYICEINLSEEGDQEALITADDTEKLFNKVANYHEHNLGVDFKADKKFFIRQASWAFVLALKS